MARRRVIGDGGDDDEIMRSFLGGQQQAQINPLALALQILGLQRQEREAAGDLGLKREELAMRERLGTQEEAGRQATRTHEQEMQRIANEAAEDERRHRQALEGIEREKLGEGRLKEEVGVLSEWAKAHPELKLEDLQKMMAPYSPTMQRVVASNLEQSQKQKAKDLETAVRTLYEKRAPMEQFKTLLGAYPEEVAGRVPWQQLAQEAPGPGPTGAGAAGVLFNLPGALQNVGKGVANLLSRGVLGKYGPQVPYTEFTDPFAQVPGGPPGESNLLSVIAPPINAVQPGEYAPGAGFARGRGIPLEELQRRAGIAGY